VHDKVVIFGLWLYNRKHLSYGNASVKTVDLPLRNVRVILLVLEFLLLCAESGGELVSSGMVNKLLVVKMSVG
jgi:hypothetical protein